MRLITTLCLAASCALGLSGCGNGGEAARESVRAVGSSTVYPFAVAVAEAAAQTNPDVVRALVELTGTSEGIEIFCAGSGPETPDIVNASRRMTRAEFDECRANGVAEIIELQVGLDGIVFASAANGGLTMNLTPRFVYEALAATSYGDPQEAANWSDVAGSLPGQAILVYGPPESSGTRDALQELVLMKGCIQDGRMGGLELSEPEQFEKVCGELRADGAYIDQSEQDELTVGKVADNPEALGVFGYSYFEENTDRVKALPIDGIEATYDTIASGQYPAARPLYIYVKKAHLETIPGLKAYLDQWAASWGRDGPLTRIGLVAASDRTQARNKELLTSLEPMTGEGLQ